MPGDFALFWLRFLDLPSSQPEKLYVCTSLHCLRFSVGGLQGGQLGETELWQWGPQNCDNCDNDQNFSNLQPYPKPAFVKPTKINSAEQSSLFIYSILQMYKNILTFNKYLHMLPPLYASKAIGKEWTLVHSATISDCDNCHILEIVTILRKELWQRHEKYDNFGSIVTIVTRMATLILNQLFVIIVQNWTHA